jgi:protein-S-isoprenylcysteine O-methyltransferase Ste14
MPDFILTTGSASLFGVIVVLYAYLAPSLVAFTRAHPRFWLILALNLAVGPVQAMLSQFLFAFPHPGMTMAELFSVALLLLMGPGWLVLLVWALRPGDAPDARLLAWRDTKTYDMVAALPLIAWFINSALQMRPHLSFLGGLITTGQADSLMLLQFGSLVFSARFCLLCVWLLLIRDKPVLRAQGLLPRLAALAGTFLAVGMLRLPVPDMSLFQQATIFLLTGLGTAAAIVILARLGKSFSIMPEARTLVTTGPYAYVRHPLYSAEIVILLGMMLQYQQPWALIMGSTVIALQVVRSLYEERVLSRAFPEYAEYRTRTKRFIPGVI